VTHRCVFDQNKKCARSPQFSPHPPHELFLSCVTSMIPEWHSCLSVFFAYSSCGEFYETKRLAQIDLLSARIPQMGVGGNVAFNNLKKTREMFWSGRRDLNSGPPTPKAGVISLGSPPFSISFLKINELEKYLVVARCTEMWLRMHRVSPISPSAKNGETPLTGFQLLSKTLGSKPKG
jgi:hypothetical protein